MTNEKKFAKVRLKINLFQEVQMAFSIKDFTNATVAYPCGNKKECQSFLKEVEELNGVKMPPQLRSFLRNKKNMSSKSHTADRV